MGLRLPHANEPIAMLVFVYEFITGGGAGSAQPRALPAASLLREGRAMVRAVALDLVQIPGVTPVVLHDVRLPPLDLPECEVVPVHELSSEPELFQEQVTRCDHAIAIAPETGGVLVARSQMVDQHAPGRRIGPPIDVLARCGDKHATALCLKQAGVPATHGIRLERENRWQNDFPLPAVVKPIDGAGSQRTGHVHSILEGRVRRREIPGPARVELYYPGLAASVSLLGGPIGVFPLPPGEQRISQNGWFEYLGGSIPLEPRLAARARDLALRAARAAGPLYGYTGVDLILGEAEDGSLDVVVEINPRLTTSYVGLSALAIDNLGQAILDVATGKSMSLCFRSGSVTFDAEGAVEYREGEA